MAETYKVIRRYFNNHPNQTIKRGLTLEEAQEHCQDPETSSSTCKGAENVARTEQFGPWFDGYDDE